MPTAERLTADEEGMVIACPECDRAGSVRRRVQDNTHIGDPDDPLACGSCGATFEEAVKRKAKTGGCKPRFGHLSPEDVGL